MDNLLLEQHICTAQLEIQIYQIIIIVMLNCSLQAVLLVVATVALAAPQHTGAHSAWPLPYAG